jgi:hypothetical protein
MATTITHPALSSVACYWGTAPASPMAVTSARTSAVLDREAFMAGSGFLQHSWGMCWGHRCTHSLA